MAVSREIADAISEPEIERVTLVRAARLGFTTLLSGAVGAFVVNEPSPILCLLPTEADCRDYIVSDIEPIFAASPALRGTLSANAEEGEQNTLTSSASPAARSRSWPRGRRAICVAMPPACCWSMKPTPARREPRAVAARRAAHIELPKPQDRDRQHAAAGRDEPFLRSYGQSDQRIFEVPCPACGGFTEIICKHIKWPEGSGGQGAAFRCPHCAAPIDERHKASMVSAGAWRATRLEAIGHAGFRLSALVRLLANASWSKLAAEFLAAKDDPNELMVFTNTVLAEGWAAQGAEIDDTGLTARAEPFSLNAIPAEVLALMVGADVQDDSIEAPVCGWTREGACLVLGHFVLWGAFTDPTTWLEMDELLRTRWTHPHGGKLKVDAAVIDAGDGDHADAVLSFCGPRAGRRVFAGKGMSGTRPGFQMSRGKKARTNRLAIIGVDVLKSTIFDRLVRGNPRGAGSHRAGKVEMQMQASTIGHANDRHPRNARNPSRKLRTEEFLSAYHRLTLAMLK